MRPPLRAAVVHFTTLNRDVEIPLAVADQLMAWMHDPGGTPTFLLPPIDIDGELVVLRIHRDELL